jgi:hypothetical protein
MIKQAEAEELYDRHNVGYVKIDCNWLLSQNFNSCDISKFNGKPEFFVYRPFIADTEIIILLLINIVPF